MQNGLMNDVKESVAYDPGRHCDKCMHFGGWLPTRVGEEIDYTVHGECLRPRAPRTIAQPEHACAYWAENQETLETEE